LNIEAKTMKTLPKAKTGIMGLDDITYGGLPVGRPTLVCGAAGSGKTLLSLEFIINGALEFNEPGVFMCFEEKVDELASNDGSLTRQGLEEYVSDCVILLEHRVVTQISTRYLRIVKYRGSMHGTNEYPFLIDESGISVLPVTSSGLNNEVSSERISSGIEEL